MCVFAKDNNNVKYLLTVIDVFSKYGWIIPLKNKTGESIRGAFEHIIKRSGLEQKNYGQIKEENFITSTSSRWDSRFT